VRVECFGCGAAIEAEDSEAVADRFMDHARDSHDWSYPEEAIRNYARNYAEAVGRLSGEVERLPEIGEISVHPMSADRIDDWLRFFDHDAFAGNPDWASCYCLEPHDPAPPERPERPWRETRSIMVERIGDGRTFGYLAYVDETPAGWVNASQRSDYALYRLVDPEGPDPASVIGVSCFVIAPPFRRHHIASALLDRVIADAPARGASWIEGYPLNDPDEAENQHHYRGPRSMYEVRRFDPIDVRERDTVMRRPAS
jgi:GNAT superfamily N-acetyltransferase/predicted small metal-binding protein